MEYLKKLSVSALRQPLSEFKHLFIDFQNTRQQRESNPLTRARAAPRCQAYLVHNVHMKRSASASPAEFESSKSPAAACRKCRRRLAQEKAASSWHSTKHWEFHGIGNQVVERRRRRTTHEDVEDGRTDSQSLIDGATSPIHHVALTLATKDGAP